MLLKIDDSRCLRHLNVAGIALFVALVIAYPAYLFLSEEGNKLTGIVVSGLILLAALIFFAVKALQLPYRRIYIFDKKQGIYRFIESSFLKTEENAGKLSEIKKINIEVTEYKDNESYNKDYKYQTFLILDAFLAYDNSNLLAVDEESGNYETSRKIAFSIAEFLQLPVVDDSNM